MALGGAMAPADTHSHISKAFLFSFFYFLVHSIFASGFGLLLLPGWVGFAFHFWVKEEKGKKGLAAMEKGNKQTTKKGREGESNGTLERSGSGLGLR